MPAMVDDGIKRGFIIPIGGREDKLISPTVLSRFVDICGGKSAIIAVIPTASKVDDIGDEYVEIFDKLGVAQAINLKIESRQDADSPLYLEQLERADGIFMTGGNQILLSTTLGGTAIAKMIRRLNAQGVNVAGTSAGAAYISGHMIAGGDSGFIPRADMVSLAPGLGLTNKLLVDQHFSQRDRLGRLLTALSYNPFVTGVGIDEDTAAFLDADGIIEVVGSNMLTIVDMSHLEYSSMHAAKDGEPISLVGVRMHFLLPGYRYDTVEHRVIIDERL
ncbi:MAG: cyanophycinase [Francisellaceae bacterium]